MQTYHINFNFQIQQIKKRLNFKGELDLNLLAFVSVISEVHQRVLMDVPGVGGGDHRLSFDDISKNPRINHYV